MTNEITIAHEEIKLRGIISAVQNVRGWIIFAHGSGSSRKSPRNTWVSGELNRRGYATLLFDLLSPQEDRYFDNRFNLPLLAERLKLATEWLLSSPLYERQPIAYFGASTGAGAALIAASKLPAETPLFTVISRGGRPDLAGQSALRNVFVPVLLVVGDLDHEVITLNQMALAHLRYAELKLVEGATHLFEEPGKLNEVVKLSADWLDQKLNDWALRQGEAKSEEGGSHAIR